MESFRPPPQKNILNQQHRWTIPQELRLAIVTWIEHRYHRQQEQNSPSGLTPSSSRPQPNPPRPSRPKPKLTPEPATDPCCRFCQENGGSGTGLIERKGYEPDHRDDRSVADC
ncbi:MAG: hypothetical protein B5766_09920 [Candidatus Lumbricidophila eiseniae]|uniref:Integrase catalytic domain-containing protein n=1 Tax=Candidatus Lumbricidiphila eiseniae TaxID=1969409 RepID=A0A2A6FPW0_9MICO|nr:MAG: hypothetical protein B5766_09920 [Candidatus Lumbricidophila eiseniae]